ncbi:MAG: protein translocase subunit SecF [Pseudomonadota bacterium]
MIRIPRLRLIADDTHIRFMRLRLVCFIISGVLVALSAVSVIYPGLNYGIDFKGGILMEVRMPEPADLGGMRTLLGDQGLGEVALQSFGADTDVLIRVERQPGDETEQLAAVETVKGVLEQEYGVDISYRRAEFVGPKVSEELLQDGILAIGLALGLVLIYIWLRFEWQYGVGAIVALVHDVLLTIGMFAVTGLEVNLSTVAAVLTIVGYSLNDTVVIFDRVRENLRRYKAMPVEELLDRSVNDTLARTLMTSLTTLLALLALFFFGGEVIRGFTFAMIWGVLVGTYSTIYIACPILLSFNLRSAGAKPAKDDTPAEDETGDEEGQPAKS